MLDKTHPIPHSPLHRHTLEAAIVQSQHVDVTRMTGFLTVMVHEEWTKWLTKAMKDYREEVHKLKEKVRQLDEELATAKQAYLFVCGQEAESKATTSQLTDENIALQTENLSLRNENQAMRNMIWQLQGSYR